MDLALVIKAVLALSAIGVISVALLATAAQKFAVEVDPNVEAILDVLPGANCGACGNPSCFAAAEAIAARRAPVDHVRGGRQGDRRGGRRDPRGDVRVPHRRVRAALRGWDERASRVRARWACSSCAAVNKLAGGSIVCGWGCLGYGDCVRRAPSTPWPSTNAGCP